MNTKTQHLLSDLKGLLTITIKMSDRQDLDQIFISKSRAKEILLTIKQLEKESLTVRSKHIKREPAWLNNPC